MTDDSLFREVDEEVRQERLIGLWQRFGGFVSALAIALVCLVAGVKAWQYWNLREAEKAGGAFFNATELAETGKPDEALRSFSAIPSSGFTPFARLQQASILTSQGKTSEAVALYDALAADSALDVATRDAARIGAGYALVDTMSAADLVKRLSGLEAATNPWRNQVREITGLAAYRAGDMATALKDMTAIVDDPGASPDVRTRASAMVQILKSLRP